MACRLCERSGGARQFFGWPFDGSHKQQINEAPPHARLTTELNQWKKSARHCTESQNWQMSWKRDILNDFYVTIPDHRRASMSNVQAGHCPTSPPGRLEACLDLVKCSRGCRVKGRLRAHWMLQALNRRGLQDAGSGVGHFQRCKEVCFAWMEFFCFHLR